MSEWTIGQEVLVPGIVEQIVENTVEIHIDEEFVYVNPEALLDPKAPKTISKVDGDIWLPTVPLAFGGVTLKIDGADIYAIKRGGDNFLCFVLARVGHGDTLKWVTWEYNQQTDSLFAGHYFDVHAYAGYPTEAHAYAAALEDFNLRNWG